MIARASLARVRVGHHPVLSIGAAQSLCSVHSLSALPAPAAHRRVDGLPARCAASAVRRPAFSFPCAASASTPRRCFHASRLRCRVSDPWSVLGVARGCSVTEVKAAYYALAKEHHPDGRTAQSGSATEAQRRHSAERFHRVQEAYEQLTDPQQQARAAHQADAEDDASGPSAHYARYAHYAHAHQAHADSGRSTAGRGRRRGAGASWEDVDEFVHDLFSTWKGYAARQSTTTHRHTHTHTQTDTQPRRHRAQHCSPRVHADAEGDAAVRGAQPMGRAQPVVSGGGTTISLSPWRVLASGAALRRCGLFPCGIDGRPFPLSSVSVCATQCALWVWCCWCGCCLLLCCTALRPLPVLMAAMQAEAEAEERRRPAEPRARGRARTCRPT